MAASTASLSVKAFSATTATSSMASLLVAAFSIIAMSTVVRLLPLDPPSTITSETHGSASVDSPTADPVLRIDLSHPCSQASSTVTPRHHWQRPTPPFLCPCWGPWWCHRRPCHQHYLSWGFAHPRTCGNSTARRRQCCPASVAPLTAASMSAGLSTPVHNLEGGDEVGGGWVGGQVSQQSG
jgi:hypothetical protein